MSTDNDLLREAAAQARLSPAYVRMVADGLDHALADLLDDLADDEGEVNPWAVAVARRLLGEGDR